MAASNRRRPQVVESVDGLESRRKVRAGRAPACGPDGTGGLRAGHRLESGPLHRLRRAPGLPGLAQPVLERQRRRGLPVAGPARGPRSRARAGSQPRTAREPALRHHAAGTAHAGALAGTAPAGLDPRHPHGSSAHEQSRFLAEAERQALVHLEMSRQELAHARAGSDVYEELVVRGAVASLEARLSWLRLARRRLGRSRQRAMAVDRAVRSRPVRFRGA
jgi:hypothetical protein